jgi:hypothetical protein
MKSGKKPVLHIHACMSRVFYNRMQQKLVYVVCSKLPPICSHTQQTACTREDKREKENNDITLPCYSQQEMKLEL